MISAVAATASLKRRDSPFMNDTDVSPISRKRLRLSFDSREHVEEQKEQAENSVESMIWNLGDAIGNVASLNDSFDLGDTQDDVLRDFRATQIPSFSFSAYLGRLVKYLGKWKQAEVAHSGDLGKNGFEVREATGLRAIVMALVYADRIHKLFPKSRLSSWNLHRVILTGMLIATKFTEDRPLSNKFWAQVGGLRLGELNKLESTMCSLLGYNMFVKSEEFERCVEALGF